MFNGDRVRFSSLEFLEVCVPLVSKRSSATDSVVVNGSYIAHRLICGPQKTGSLASLPQGFVKRFSRTLIDTAVDYVGAS